MGLRHRSRLTDRRQARRRDHQVLEGTLSLGPRSVGWRAGLIALFVLTAACGSGNDGDSSSTTIGSTAAESSITTQPETTTTDTAAPAPGPDAARIAELFDGLIGNLRLQPTTYFPSQQ